MLLGLREVLYTRALSVCHDVPHFLQGREQGSMRRIKRAFPGFEVPLADSLNVMIVRFLLLRRDWRSGKVSMLSEGYLGRQGVHNVLPRIQQRIKDKLNRVKVLGHPDLAEEKGALRDLPLCFLEHGLSPHCAVLS